MATTQQIVSTTRRHLLQAAAIVGFGGGVARAQGFPSQPIRLIVAYSPGGGVDAVGRILAEPLTTAFGQPVVVENRAGAGGSIGVDAMVRSAPDGHTMTIISPATATVGPLVRQTPYDPLTLGFIGRMVSSPLLMVCRNDFPAQNLAEFVAMVRSRPGSVNFASAGPGTLTHLVAETVNLRLGADMTHVPYRGTGPAMTDIMGSKVDIFFSDSSALGLVEQKRARILAVTTGQRWARVPDTPALAELVPGIDAANWYGMAAPPNTPAPIRREIYDQIARALARDEIRTAIRRVGFDPAPLPPDEFAEFVRAEVAGWTPIIRAAGIKVE